ncbi:hypothetical protein FBU30_009973 [Linnemannia zychae]|nr:hypothetical protein FBU30_009973 [Linnemannia zychae]
MSTTIPNYPNPCLAADEANSAVYLVGVAPAIQGRLEVNYISVININAPTSSPVGTQVNTLHWSSGAPKACFIYPSKAFANSPLAVYQFGENLSYNTVIAPNGTIVKPSGFVENSFLSPKLFALTGSVGAFNWFLAMTNDTSPWAGIRQNFTDPGYDLYDLGLTNYPTKAPLVAVGTYSVVANPPSKGYAVVFDQSGQGEIFAAEGSVLATISNDIHVTILGLPTAVQMNSIKLSAQAIPVTMTNTGYLLDKASDGSTVIYSIAPGSSANLMRIDVNGGRPPFVASMAATAMNNQIITYSPSISGSPTFNSFDTTTMTWSGPGLMTDGDKPPINPDPAKSTPLGAIIGGAVGGLLVIAIAIFLIVRYRRKNQQNKSTENPSAAHQPKSGNNTNNGIGGQKDHLEDLPQMQYAQYYQAQPYETQQKQQQQYVAMSPAGFIPPPPSVNPYAVTSFEAYRPTSTDEVPSEINVNPYELSYVNPTSYTRESIYPASPSTTTTNADYSYAKSRGSSYIGSNGASPLPPQGPQLYPQNEESNTSARSPQSLPDILPISKTSS